MDSGLEMDQLGRYKLSEIIGEGAMSRVYRAYDPTLQRILAIKVLKPEYAGDNERQRLFLTEGHISAKLNHHNIVSTFDVGEVDNTPYIVMEYVEGQSLDTWLESQDNVELDQTVDILLQVAYALEYAHSKGIIHRDIKPSNILIEPSGKVMLTDFGVAYLHDQSDGAIEQTIVGTPFYMAPEQLNGATPDVRSDLYSCGVLFYKMVFSILPFEASSIRELVAVIQGSEIDLSTSNCPHAITKVIKKLLHRKPSFRYSNTTELIKQLRALQPQLAKADCRLADRIKVSWRYTAVASVILSGFLISFLVFVLGDLSNNLSGTISSYGKMLVEQTKEQVDEALLLEDKPALGIIVQRLSQIDEIKYLIVSDHNSNIWAASDSDLIDSKYQTPLQLERIEHTESVDIFRLEQESQNGSDVYHVISPITFNGKAIGKVIVGLSAKSVTDIWRKTAWMLAMFIAISCLSITAVIYILCRFFENQFKKLGDALQSLSVGNYYTRLHVERMDKMGYANRQFNELAEQIEELVKKSEPDFEVDEIPSTKISANEPNTVVLIKKEIVT